MITQLFAYRAIEIAHGAQDASLVGIDPLERPGQLGFRDHQCVAADHRGEIRALVAVERRPDRTQVGVGAQLPADSQGVGVAASTDLGWAERVDVFARPQSKVALDVANDFERPILVDVDA